MDLRQAVGSPTGVGRYLLGLANAAAAHQFQVRAYTGKHVPGGLHPGVEVRRIEGRGPVWHLRVWRDLRARPATYISTSLVIPQLPGIRALPVVLDLTTVLYPGYHTFRTRMAERWLMPRAVRRWPILTCTATTAGDLIRRFGERTVVTVVPPALPEPKVLRSNVGDPPYVLYVGTLEPRKNITTALRAVRRLRAAGRDLRLVVVGKVGWHASALQAELDEAVLDGSADILGYVTDEERDRLYAAALAVVIPSVYEGFGLPLLEAMARGVPCICSDATALVEVSAGAALHVGTFDVDEWATVIEQLLESPALRQTLGDRERRRASAFSSSAAAAALRHALGMSPDSVVGSNPRS